MSELPLEPLAAVLDWHLPRAVPAGAWLDHLKAFMEALAAESVKHGPVVIGHIKGFADLQGGGFLTVSAISASHPASGEIFKAAKEPIPGLSLTLNMLVYGLPHERAKAIVVQTAISYAEKWNGKVEIRHLSAPADSPHQHNSKLQEVE